MRVPPVFAAAASRLGPTPQNCLQLLGFSFLADSFASLLADSFASLLANSLASFLANSFGIPANSLVPLLLPCAFLVFQSDLRQRMDGGQMVNDRVPRGKGAHQICIRCWPTDRPTAFAAVLGLYPPSAVDGAIQFISSPALWHPIPMQCQCSSANQQKGKKQCGVSSRVEKGTGEYCLLLNVDVNGEEVNKK
jgi:hypothetical protein